MRILFSCTAPWLPRLLLAALAAALLTGWGPSAARGAEPAPCLPEDADRPARCQAARDELARLRHRLATVEALVQDPETLLVRVEPEPGEGLLQLQRRTERQGGVRTLLTNTFLPIGELFADPQDGTLFVTLSRRQLWQYVGEALGYDSPEALQVFGRREDLSRREKRDRFLAPGGELDRLRSDVGRQAALAAECCGALPPEAPATPPPVGRP
jgi:hypothetical protein